MNGHTRFQLPYLWYAVPVVSCKVLWLVHCENALGPFTVSRTEDDALNSRPKERKRSNVTYFSGVCDAALKSLTARVVVGNKSSQDQMTNQPFPLVILGSSSTQPECPVVALIH